MNDKTFNEIIRLLTIIQKDLSEIKQIEEKRVTEKESSVTSKIKNVFKK